MTERHVVCKLTDIQDKRGKAFELGGQRISVFRDGDRVFALGDSCSHIGASLEEGIVADGTVVCPWHGARFSLENGQPLGPPARGGVGCWPCAVEGEDVVVEA